jgi:hypothetical protein
MKKSIILLSMLLVVVFTESTMASSALKTASMEAMSKKDWPTAICNWKKISEQTPNDSEV